MLVVAAAIWLLPGGGEFARFVIEMLGAVMLAAVALVGYRFAREHSLELNRLEANGRAVLFGSLGLLVIAMVGRPVLWSTAAGSALWLAMAGLVVAGAVVSWRAWREL